MEFPNDFGPPSRHALDYSQSRRAENFVDRRDAARPQFETRRMHLYDFPSTWVMRNKYASDYSFAIWQRDCSVVRRVRERETEKEKRLADYNIGD